jgi:hypothetical protein
MEPEYSNAKRKRTEIKPKKTKKNKQRTVSKKGRLAASSWLFPGVVLISSIFRTSFSG